MRIWLITVGEPLPTDGKDIRLFRTGILADLMVKQGHHVVWWTSTFNHMAKHQRFEEDTVIDLNERLRIVLLHSIAYDSNVSFSRILNHIGIARRFSARASQEDRPDIILVSLPTLELSLAAVKFGKRNKIPVVVDIRDLWPDIFVNLFPRPVRSLGRLMIQPYFRIAKTVCRQASAIIGITSHIVAWGLNYAGRLADRWDTDFPLAYPDGPPGLEAVDSAEKLWRQLGVTSNDETFLACFFGTFGRQFDLKTVIKAAGILEEQKRNIKIILCGTGDNLDQYRQLAGSRQNLIFPGWVGAAGIWTLMHSSRVGLAPYFRTADFELSIPNKVIEYLSAGLPIVSSLRGTVAGLIDRHDCGSTYEQGNPYELANILSNLQAQPTRQQMMSKNARRLYEQAYSAEIVYGKLADHLRDIAESYKRIK